MRLGEDGCGDVRALNDAVFYVCELLSYFSLNVLREEKEFGRVVFLHIPRCKAEESEEGVEVGVALMVACVKGLLEEYRLIA